MIESSQAMKGNDRGQDKSGGEMDHRHDLFHLGPWPPKPWQGHAKELDRVRCESGAQEPTQGHHHHAQIK